MTDRRKLLFLVSEDWFFISHFLVTAQAAIHAGFDVRVALRVKDEARVKTIEDAGVKLIRINHVRGFGSPLAMLGDIGNYARVIRGVAPDVLHLVSLRIVLFGAVAGILAGARKRLHAVTGLGVMGASTSAKAKIARRVIGFLLRYPLNGRNVRLVFENADDPISLGLNPNDPRHVTVGGAGVDPDAWAVAPLPPGRPLKLALVARMVESKGVIEAVEAVQAARRQGADVTLDLYGDPDPENPRSITEATLRQWSQHDGIAWHGRTLDIARVWRDHHIALVPSRGGEGLPRSLLEAAASGRAILTTSTPGCDTYVRDGIEGLIVPPADVPALTKAILRFCADPTLVTACAQAARARLNDGFTTAAVTAKFVAVYQELARSR
ncbi:glycosyltransferase family 4 protein [Methylovirgula sp. 4M-Z18]|uniref:glycosyltransferase family 4 protein n=1 Tax=Methylovirgula sp. 4M-Z18 TaxID=2293567 RepID=UPI000E2E6EE4|nr:glycosyltransferase family 4 protein [Methylovirgula sp. 4M-Z18]RFB78577.1 glycosyltransferase family 1 protein [Methylovirgula sp. 4M-Z18]